MKDEQYWIGRANAVAMQADFIRHAAEQIDIAKFGEFLADADLIESISSELRLGAEVSHSLRVKAKSRQKEISSRAEAIFRARKGDWKITSSFLTGVAHALGMASRDKGGSYTHSNAYLYDAVDDSQFARGETDLSEPQKEMKWQQHHAEELVSTHQHKQQK